MSDQPRTADEWRSFHLWRAQSYLNGAEIAHGRETAEGDREGMLAAKLAELHIMLADRAELLEASSG